MSNPVRRSDAHPTKVWKPQRPKDLSDLDQVTIFLTSNPGIKQLNVSIPEYVRLVTQFVRRSHYIVPPAYNAPAPTFTICGVEIIVDRTRP